MKKKIITLTLLIVLTITGALIFKSYSEKDKNEATYEVATAVGGDFQLFVEETGQVTSNSEISVYTSKNLMVSKIYFELGDTVKKGDVILTFDSTDKNSALRSIQEKKLSLEQKERDYRNASELLIVGGTTKVDLEDINYEMKIMRLEIASLEEDYKQYEDKIISPVDGVISEMIADDNYRVDTDSPLLKITDISDLSVTVSLTDYDARNVKLGQTVLITSDSLQEEEVIKGKVIDIGSTATKDDSYDESYVEIEIEMENSGVLKPGNVVNVKILYLDEKNVIKLPYTSVLNENNKYYVYVVDKENKVKKIEVTVGETDDDFYQITNGIEIGDIVIKEADLNLKDGEKIRISEEKEKKTINEKVEKNKRESPPMGPGGPPM